MASDFVPFFPSVGGVNATPGAAAQFAPGVPVASAVPTLPLPIPAKRDVKVELKREGDRIVQIRIHCGCGELIELACDYNVGT